MRRVAECGHDWAMNAWPELNGKAILVTGASRGLGQAIARALSGAGARLALAGRDAQALAAEAQALQALALPADVADPAACARLIAQAQAQLGPLDGLVNNAALFAVEPLIEASAQSVSAMFATNVQGPLLLAQAFARGARSGGAIVNISSIAAARPASGCGLYSASKAALEALTKVMAREWGARGLRVNALAPGHIATPGVLEDLAAGKFDPAGIPLGRIATSEEVAQAALFLLSSRSHHITGAVLTIDGGEGL